MGTADFLDAGRIELLEVLFGLHKSVAGEIKLRSEEVHGRSTGEAIHNGFALCMEERRFSGIFLDLSISSSIMIS